VREGDILQGEGIKIIVPSSLKNLSLIRALVKTYLISESVSQKDILKLLTVIDELATNAIEHGYNYNNGEISIFMIKEEDAIKITVEDFGSGFDRTKKSKAEGGMGLSIVQGLVDNLEIKPKKVGTKFEILKKIEEESK
jgi:serine/threonine-protein kinase RsbW